MAPLFALVRANAVADVLSMLDSAGPHAAPQLLAARDEAGNTPLMVACSAGHRRLTKAFVTRGGGLNAQNERGQTALHYAYGFGHTELGHFLISSGADDSLRNSYGLLPYDGLVPLGAGGGGAPGAGADSLRSRSRSRRDR